MPLIGRVDEISRSLVNGWTVDTDHPEAALSVAVVVNGKLVARREAGEFRPGLKEHLGGGATGFHQFFVEFDPPLPMSAAQAVEVFVEGCADRLDGASARLDGPPAAPPGAERRRLRAILGGAAVAALAAPVLDRAVALSSADLLLDSAIRPAGTGPLSLLDGWSPVEADYAWSAAATASLHIAWPAGARPRSIWVVLKPYVSPPTLPRQRIGARFDGHWLGEIETSEYCVIALDLDGLPASADNQSELALTFPDARRPSDLEAGHNDARLLGCALFRVLAFGAGARPAADMPDGGETPSQLRDLMLRFESLGENCEFGLVQRRCGAEPLGLLRFASAPLPKLLAALDARFEGMGAPGAIHVELTPNGGEYMVLDQAFGFYTHAWVLAGEMTPEQIVAREQRRVPFLVRKLLEDFSAGKKLFVYHGGSPLSLPQAEALAHAVKRLGPSTLLWVEVRTGSEVGTVERISDNLLKGYIDRFAPGDNAHDLSLSGWVRVCRAAAAVHSGAA